MQIQAVVINNLSGVFERLERESYLALEEVVGGLPILADLASPGVDNIGIVFGEDCGLGSHKVLGVSWDLKSDELLPLAGVHDIMPKKLTLCFPYCLRFMTQVDLCAQLLLH